MGREQRPDRCVSIVFALLLSYISRTKWLLVQLWRRRCVVAASLFVSRSLDSSIRLEGPKYVQDQVCFVPKMKRLGWLHRFIFLDVLNYKRLYKCAWCVDASAMRGKIEEEKE